MSNNPDVSPRPPVGFVAWAASPRAAPCRRGMSRRRAGASDRGEGDQLDVVDAGKDCLEVLGHAVEHCLDRQGLVFTVGEPPEVGGVDLGDDRSVPIVDQHGRQGPAVSFEIDADVGGHEPLGPRVSVECDTDRLTDRAACPVGADQPLCGQDEGIAVRDGPHPHNVVILIN